MIRAGVERIAVQGRVWLDGYVKLGLATASWVALVPKAGFLHVYAKAKSTVSRLYYRDDANTEHEIATIADIISDHGALSGLTDDDHTQYRLESEDHTHETTGMQGGKLDHGLALNGLTDDDHTQYVLRSILTTNGDIFVRTAGAVSRLGVGSEEQVLSVVSGAPAWAEAAGDGSEWSVLTNGDPSSPELMWDSNGDVMMTEILR